MKKHLSSFLLLVSFIGHQAMAEEMKFGYSLAGNQNICFLQNVAENIQGRYHWRGIYYSCDWGHSEWELSIEEFAIDCQWPQGQTAYHACKYFHFPICYRRAIRSWGMHSQHMWAATIKSACWIRIRRASPLTLWSRLASRPRTTPIS